MRKQMKISRFLITARRHLKKWLRVFHQPRPLGHMKGIAMKFMDKLSSSLGGLSLWRIGNGVAALLLALTLAACGGGGGGGTGTKPADPPASSPVNPPDPPASSPVNPPDPPASSPTNPPMPPSGKLSVEPSDKCVVTVEGEGNCPRTLHVSDLKNTSGKLAIFGPNGQSWPANNAGVPVVASLGESIYRLVDDKAELSKVTVTVSCAADLVEQGKNCVKKTEEVTYYDRANVLISGEAFKDSGNGTFAIGYPQLLVGKTRIMVKNMTGVQVGGCQPSSLKLANGLPAVKCHEPKNGNIMTVFPIDPVKRELLPAYKGQLPDGIVFYGAPYGEYGDTPYTQYDVQRKGTYIDVPGVGTYYWTASNGGELRLTRDVFKTYEVIQTGETFIVIMTYSNPAP